MGGVKRAQGIRVAGRPLPHHDQVWHHFCGRPDGGRLVRRPSLFRTHYRWVRRRAPPPTGSLYLSLRWRALKRLGYFFNRENKGLTLAQQGRQKFVMYDQHPYKKESNAVGRVYALSPSQVALRGHKRNKGGNSRHKKHPDENGRTKWSPLFETFFRCFRIIARGVWSSRQPIGASFFCAECGFRCSVREGRCQHKRRGQPQYCRGSANPNNSLEETTPAHRHEQPHA